MFNHEVVPDHLRTKPDPEVEEQEKQLSTDAARIGADVAQVKSFAVKAILCVTVPCRFQKDINHIHCTSWEDFLGNNEMYSNVHNPIPQLCWD